MFRTKGKGSDKKDEKEKEVGMEKGKSSGRKTFSMDLGKRVRVKDKPSLNEMKRFSTLAKKC